jgi:hypothetical protein
MKTLDQLRPSITSLDAIPAIPAIVQPLASMLQLPVEQVNVEQVVQLVPSWRCMPRLLTYF